MNEVFLIGGGWQADSFKHTYGHFLRSAARGTRTRIAIVAAEEEGADAHQHFLRFRGAFEVAGLDSGDTFEVIVSAKNPLTAEKLNKIQPTGIFVGGGLTPAYYDALCLEKSWLGYLSANKIPYCGFSAGASVAAENAIIGGWRRRINDRTVEIADENAGEDLDLLDVRKGLDLVPFAVDVHATQWGTLLRLIHAIDAEFAEVGWAIDENTMIKFDENKVRVSGIGNAYNVRRQNGENVIKVFQSE